ncbi:LmbE family N-acetylglucosaminyl deacetylase [Sphingobium sp. AEW010]|uniref:PIG-L deacetylase family protein n=1 Tax=Sphingobium sp. JAI105 TaxID=2787715 RepID=UPI001199EED3|nr:LmbE family N-acetylglucosaminyl deacetylase [Sphingobium sp. AEW010]TWD16426.1 LmbE family N-acetylglucosaminyl deacetylase [Sphingobium sp. AEW013]TWD19745.1 LmbE family N-acetylglucosaminyl deacetylase [Sphingobium sp. AEW001]
MKAEPLAQSRWAQARWLVLAPHPDDETLGAGALITHCAANGRLGGIVFLTDGTGSHPEGTPRVAATRRREARNALGRLGAKAIPTIWMGWRDAHPHSSDSKAFARDTGRLAALLRWHRIDAIAVSDKSEAHCDHVAAYKLAEAARRKARRPVALFAYHVWSEAPRRARRIATPVMPVGQRRHALLAHRSQLSPVIGQGFRLPQEKLRMVAQDVLALRGDCR